jgi:type IV pilus assembly protein PilP
MLFLGTLALAACSESEKGPVRQSPTTSGSVQQPITQATPTVKTEEKGPPAYSYIPVGRRDPFAPLIAKAEGRERSSVRPPLERYNITEFKLTGIVWGGFGFNAVMESPEGKGYFVRVGSTIGPNRGTVTKITKDNVVIEERFKNYTGEMESKQTVMQLHIKQEGMP